MHTLSDIIFQLEWLDVDLIVDGSRLGYRPKQNVSPELAERIRAHKEELLEFAKAAKSDADDDWIDENEFCWSQLYPEDRAHLLGPRQYPGPCAFCGGRLAHSGPCKAQRRDWELSAILPWGRYKGHSVAEIPLSYAIWLRGQANVPSDVLRAVDLRLNEHREGYRSN